jgi:YidC/Oxa1 family membrane protein insertase
MNAEKRLFLALILCLGIVFLYQKFFEVKMPVRTTAVQQHIPQPAVSPAVKGPNEKTPEIKKPASAVEKEIIKGSDKYDIIFSTKGGAVKAIKLKGFGEEGKAFFAPKNAEDSLFLVKSDLVKGLEDGMFSVSEKGDAISFTAEDPGYIRVVKRFVLEAGKNTIKSEVAITNLSPAKQNFNYTLICPSGMEEYGQKSSGVYLEANADIDGKIEKKNSVKGIWEKKGALAWVGEKNLYFALAVKPLSQDKIVGMSGDRQKGLKTWIRTGDFLIGPGETKKEEYTIYAGSLETESLKKGWEGLEQLLDYGWFGGISKGLVFLLRFFHKGAHNWGLAIIILTLVINVITFPLTRKSFVSMQKMKQIQPHMQKLKDLHKDNPQKLNKEMVELYKQYNINPLGGCLPMLLQIPIFIALYQALIHSLELRGASFLWIKDLAKPDALGLPFALPFLGNALNILPLLMIVMMFLQQKVSAGSAGEMSPEQAQQQKMMMYLMPAIFGFMFYSMPSGLVLYWLTNTVLMTGEQFMLNKKMAKA